MGSRSKPRDRRHATSPGRTRARGKKRPEAIRFADALDDLVRARAEKSDRRKDRNRRRRGAPSPYRVKVAQAIAGLAVFS